MSDVLFDVSGEREKLPTLRQFLKDRGNRKIAQRYAVLIVWKPSTYQTIVFETDSFRAIVYKGDVAYSQIESRLDDIVYGQGGIGVVVDKANPGKFQIVSVPNENPAVEPIGEYGYRFTY